MADDRLRHDVAWTTATHILEVFARRVFVEEEQARIWTFAEIYARVQAGLECFEIQAERMQRRLKPRILTKCLVAVVPTGD